MGLSIYNPFRGEISKIISPNTMEVKDKKEESKEAFKANKDIHVKAPSPVIKIRK